MGATCGQRGQCHMLPGNIRGQGGEGQGNNVWGCVSGQHACVAGCRHADMHGVAASIMGG